MQTTLYLRCGWLAATFLLFVTIGRSQSVASFSLIDAVQDTFIAPLATGDTLRLTDLPDQINFRAETTPDTVGSVVFDFNGISQFRTENVRPYQLFAYSDSLGGYWTPEVGMYTLSATAYDSINGQGNGSIPLAIVFYIVDTDTLTGNGEDCILAGHNTLDVTGSLKKWHRIALDFHGPYAHEDCNPNPFLDYRLEVVFHHPDSNRTYVVPGFFAADGKAAETGASEGHIWRCYFAPDLAGHWDYTVRFRHGTDVAVTDDPNAGIPIAFDGIVGGFSVAPTDKAGRDHRAQGRLNYVGKRYLQYAETQDYFIKTGADSPETFLAYADFDGATTNGTPLKDWAPHIPDWQAGDPSWQGGKGKGMIGAINYLAAQGQNAFSFLTFNVEGDGKNVWPYISSEEFHRFDVSKLDQWEIVFRHADQLGMYLHFKMQETENDELLDNGDLGRSRKLYFRELIARFGHHLALNWNLGEENNQTTEQRRAMVEYFATTDPYRHPVVVHNGHPFNDLLGDSIALAGVSVQSMWNQVHGNVRHWVKRSADAGKPWVVANDEQGPANIGVPVDPTYPDAPADGYTQADIRKAVLWGTLMAGGAGTEYYFGYGLPQNDLNCEDYRARERMWGYNAIAANFFRDYLPFWEMENHNGLVGNTDHSTLGKFCFAKPGDTYAVFLPDGGSADLDLENYPDTLEVFWYNPRTGGALEVGSIAQVHGPGLVNIGLPPTDAALDWLALLRPVTVVTATEPLFQATDWQLFPNPATDALTVELAVATESVLLLHDGLGKEVKRWRLNPATTTLPLAVDPGVYFAHLVLDGHAVAVKKLIVVK